jgi:hypothetical protein
LLSDSQDRRPHVDHVGTCLYAGSLQYLPSKFKDRQRSSGSAFGFVVDLHGFAVLSVRRSQPFVQRMYQPGQNLITHHEFHAFHALGIFRP